jgi:hypothetical protein
MTALGGGELFCTEALSPGPRSANGFGIVGALVIVDTGAIVRSPTDVGYEPPVTYLGFRVRAELVAENPPWASVDNLGIQRQLGANLAYDYHLDDSIAGTCRRVYRDGSSHQDCLPRVIQRDKPLVTRRR